MKLPKTLLAAIVAGITLQAGLSSCTKDTPEEKLEVKTEKEGAKTDPTYNCPACGMG